MNKIAMYKEEIMKEASIKKDDAKRDNDTETRVWRDRVKPELKRAVKSFPATLGGSIVGGIAGTAISGGNPKAGQLGGLAAGSIASYKSRRKQEKQELDRLSNRYFGKDAAKEQHDTVKSKRLAATAFNAIPGGGALGMITSNAKTPESVIQRARREKAYKTEKKASGYLDELVKEAGVRKEYKQTLKDFNSKLNNAGLENGIVMANNTNQRAEKEYPRKKFIKDRMKKALIGAAPGIVASGVGAAKGNVDMQYLGMLAGTVGAGVGTEMADRKYLKAQTKAMREELNNHSKTTKKASDCLDELVKEAGVVNHASKAVNGAKRVGQLLTGSRAKSLKKSLNTLSNSPAGNLADSVKTGNKMLSTQKALDKEIGKVRATRAGVAGTAIGTALTNSNKKTNEQGI